MLLIEVNDIILYLCTVVQYSLHIMYSEYVVSTAVQ
jgi:hypothetical protein